MQITFITSEYEIASVIVLDEQDELKSYYHESYTKETHPFTTFELMFRVGMRYKNGVG